MKSGASDPFADDPSPGAETDETDEADEFEETADAETGAEQSTGEVTEDSNTGQLNRADLPYKLRRDKVKDERDSVHQLFVQDDTDAEERDARRDLEDRFEEDVYKLDAREAIYLAGMRNVGDAEEILREWGYDL